MSNSVLFAGRKYFVDDRVADQIRPLIGHPGNIDVETIDGRRVTIPAALAILERTPGPEWLVA